MEKIAAFAWLTHFELGVARKRVANKDPERIALEAPGVILKRAQVVAIESVGTVLARKHGILQLRRAVLLSEKEAKGVLGIVRAPAESAADANPGINLEALRAVRINQLDRCRPFPGDGVPARVRVDAGRRIEQIRQVGDEGIGGKCLEIVDDGAAVGG